MVTTTEEVQDTIEQGARLNAGHGDVMTSATETSVLSYGETSKLHPVQAKQFPMRLLAWGTGRCKDE